MCSFCYSPCVTNDDEAASIVLISIENIATTNIRFIHVEFQISVTIHMFCKVMRDAEFIDFVAFLVLYHERVYPFFVQFSHMLLPPIVIVSHMLECFKSLTKPLSYQALIRLFFIYLA